MFEHRGIKVKDKQKESRDGFRVDHRESLAHPPGVMNPRPILRPRGVSG